MLGLLCLLDPDIVVHLGRVAEVLAFTFDAPLHLSQTAHELPNVLLGYHLQLGLLLPSLLQVPHLRQNAVEDTDHLCFGVLELGPTVLVEDMVEVPLEGVEVD